MGEEHVLARERVRHASEPQRRVLDLLLVNVGSVGALTRPS